MTIGRDVQGKKVGSSSDGARATTYSGDGGGDGTTSCGSIDSERVEEARLPSGPPTHPSECPYQLSDVDRNAEESNSKLQMSAQLENAKRLARDTGVPRSDPETIRISLGDSSIDAEELKSHLETSVERWRSRTLTSDVVTRGDAELSAQLSGQLEP